MGEVTGHPEVSVIVPAFRPAGFEALRASMAANARADAEWIVVDDGSGAQYAALFTALEQDGVRLLTLPENRGQAAARNAGLGAARGRFIKLLDADDRLDEGHIEALVAAARAPTEVPFAPTRHVFSNGTSLDNMSWQGLDDTALAQLVRMLRAPFLHHCGALFPRALLDDLSGYDAALVTDEDGDLLLRVLQAGAWFVPVPAVRYHYIHHAGEGRVSRDDDARKFEARVRVCRKFRESYEDRGVDMPLELKRALAARLDKIAVSQWASDRTGAKALLAEARALAPDYRPEGRRLMRLVRLIGGPGAAIRLAQIVRVLRNRPV